MLLTVEIEKVEPFTIETDNIRLIGEFTVEHWHLGDDYFLVIVEGSTKYEFSYYAKGIDSLINELENILGADLTTGLANSTSWKSRIMWPQCLKDQELFELKAVEPSSLFGKVLRILGWQSSRGFYTKSVQAYLDTPHRFRAC